MLEKQLGRDHATIRQRYGNVLKDPNCIRGQWSIEEEEISLQILFTNKSSNTELIESISLQDLRPVGQELNRRMHDVCDHWVKRLKPVLLAFHDQSLFTYTLPSFLTYLIDKKISATQEIDWEEVKRFFPTQTGNGLGMELNNQIKSLNQLNPHEIHCPVYLKLEKNAFHWKSKELSNKNKLYRERISDLYDKYRKLPRD